MILFVDSGWSPLRQMPMLVYLRFVILFVLGVMLSGCAGLYERQTPAPVVRTHRNDALRVRPKAGRPTDRPLAMPVPPDALATQPLETFKPEMRPIEVAPLPESVGGSTLSLPEVDGDGEQTGLPAPDISQSADHSVSPAQETPEFNPVQPRIEVPPEPEVSTLTPFEPIEPPASSSPAVGALVLAANENSEMGNVDVASSSIDRALKIEPRNPSLYYKLALLRLKQAKPQEAEDLAKKSALLAGQDRQLKKHSWLLIAHARELRHDFQGARAARAKANSF